MAKITFKGNPVDTSGDLPKVGSTAPAFALTKNDLSPLATKDLAGKKVVLNIFPSIDTGVLRDQRAASSTRRRRS